MQEEYITNEAWKKMLMFFKSEKRIYIGFEAKLRKFINAIYWMARSGAQWRMLPKEYGKWNSVFTRFNDWSKKGIWERLHAFCIQDPDLESEMIDATIVRAHACSAGYGKQEKEGLGRSKGGFTSKIHVKVDALGNSLKFIVTAGQKGDITQAKALVEDSHGSNVIADKAYDCDPFRVELKEKKCTPVIPYRSNRKEPQEYDKHIYKERHAIECFFSKIKYFRRVFSRFDKSARNFIAFLSFVGAIIWLR